MKLTKVGALNPNLLNNTKVVTPIANTGPLVCLGANSKILWQNPHISHHAIEITPNKRIWICSYLPEEPGDYFLNDAIIQVDSLGKTRFKRSLDSIFAHNPRHDYSNYNPKTADRYHLNDVEPVRFSGPFWQEGDVFVSVRNLNLIFLYRPTENRVLWSRHSPWKHQHDVEILNDSVITLFNNNRKLVGRDTYEVPNNQSQMLAYNFACDSVYPLFPEFFAKHGIISGLQGRAKFFPKDSLLFVEADGMQRLYLKDFRKNTTYRRFLPAENDRIQSLQWSRLVGIAP